MRRQRADHSAPVEKRNRIDWAADALGLAVLAAIAGVLAVFSPTDMGPWPIWFFIYMVWAAYALYYWYRQDAPKQKAEWLKYAICSILFAMVVLCVLRAISMVIHGSDEPENSRFFDYAMALMVSPGFTGVCIAGWARSFVVFSARPIGPP